MRQTSATEAPERWKYNEMNERRQENRRKGRNENGGKIVRRGTISFFPSASLFIRVDAGDGEERAKEHQRRQKKPKDESRKEPAAPRGAHAFVLPTSDHGPYISSTGSKSSSSLAVRADAEGHCANKPDPLFQTPSRFLCRFGSPFISSSSLIALRSCLFLRYGILRLLPDRRRTFFSSTLRTVSLCTSLRLHLANFASPPRFTRTLSSRFGHLATFGRRRRTQRGTGNYISIPFVVLVNSSRIPVFRWCISTLRLCLTFVFTRFFFLKKRFSFCSRVRMP